MSTLRIDPTASTLTVRTRAAGMLARLAHDLEIAASELSGHVRLEDGGAWSAELLVRVSGLRVSGTLHGDRLEPAGLSPGDRLEVERRIREEVLIGTSEIRVRATSRSADRADARVELRSGTAAVDVRLEVSEQPGGGARVSGTSQLSLRALGVREVRGPLGAFKLKDEIEVRFDLALRPEPAGGSGGALTYIDTEDPRTRSPDLRRRRTRERGVPTYVDGGLGGWDGISGAASPRWQIPRT